jgi:23S rRNA pseudoU1915 N3-methylase RlmH
MPAWVKAGYDDYAKRMPREFALELVELKLEPRDVTLVAQMLAAEALRIRAACEGHRPWARRARRRVDDAAAGRAARALA